MYCAIHTYIPTYLHTASDLQSASSQSIPVRVYLLLVSFGLLDSVWLVSPSQITHSVPACQSEHRLAVLLWPSFIPKFLSRHTSTPSRTPVTHHGPHGCSTHCWSRASFGKLSSSPQGVAPSEQDLGVCSGAYPLQPIQFIERCRNTASILFL
ncbi:hypothetical protein QC763_107605 [Podospora pseudopauciseta]|uniref:Uncharacterized protein n=1 Tax=Podospora pseudopauciseta TaxID=2093780 RepID=A0ABR0HY05_9PEZI|nr:hypothetical protein QC763_107605 [Podospora pseudopauciseta]